MYKYMLLVHIDDNHKGVEPIQYQCSVCNRGKWKRNISCFIYLATVSLSYYGFAKVDLEKYTFFGHIEHK